MAVDVLMIGVGNLDDLIRSVKGEFVLVWLCHLPPKKKKESQNFFSFFPKERQRCLLHSILRSHGAEVLPVVDDSLLLGVVAWRDGNAKVVLVLLIHAELKAWRSLRTFALAARSGEAGECEREHLFEKHDYRMSLNLALRDEVGWNLQTAWTSARHCLYMPLPDSRTKGASRLWGGIWLVLSSVVHCTAKCLLGTMRVDV